MSDGHNNTEEDMEDGEYTWFTCTGQKTLRNTTRRAVGFFPEYF